MRRPPSPPPGHTVSNEIRGHVLNDLVRHHLAKIKQNTKKHHNRLQHAIKQHHRMKQTTAPSTLPVSTHRLTCPPSGPNQDLPPSCLRPRAELKQRTASRSTQFANPLGSVSLFNKLEPAAAIELTMCADTGCTTGLIQKSTATAAGLPNLGPSASTITVANGGVQSASGTTRLPFRLPPEQQCGLVVDDRHLRDNLQASSPSLTPAA